MANCYGSFVVSSHRWSRVRSWVDRKTADMCNDYPGQEVFNEPPLRSGTRFIVTIFAILVALITIVLVYVNSAGSRIVTHWGSGYLLTLSTSHENYPNLLCPCNKSAIPWPYFIKFYWINQTDGHPGMWNRYPLTNYTQFCDPLLSNETVTGKWRPGCYSMAQSLTEYTDQTMRTTIATNTVKSPSVLAHMISVDMQNNVDDAFLDYSYLASNYTSDWMLLLKVKQMLKRAAHRLDYSTRYMTDPNATNAAYWRFFRGDSYTSPTGTKTKAFDLTGHRALVIEMTWAAYVEQCNPLYCNQVVKNSLMRRFVTAVTEVGGFSAVMVVLLRGLVWPSIRYISRWP